MTNKLEDATIWRNAPTTSDKDRNRLLLEGNIRTLQEKIENLKESLEGNISNGNTALAAENKREITDAEKEIAELEHKLNAL